MPTLLKIRHLLQRVAHMSREEASFRMQQELWNRLEAYRCRMGFAKTTDTSWLTKPGTSQPSGRFFFSSIELPAVLHVIRSRFPNSAADVVERAERILAHRFDLLGFHDLDFGPRINWHFDPVNRRQSPRTFSYRIPYLDLEKAGDSKIIWELNRHQHFVTLGKAYQLTGDEKFPEEFVSQFYDWQEQNPFLVGINWTSSLEVAFRSLSWLWARELFQNSPSCQGKLARDLLFALGRNGRFLEHNLSRYFSRNTHLLGEAVALFFIGVMCPQLKNASDWRALGWRIILEEAQYQVRPDGGYFEQAVYYHVYALDMLLHARILASRNLQPIPTSLDRTLERMLDFLAALCTGSPPPRLGDDDGGRLFDPRRNRAEHMSDPLSTGAVIFGRAEWKAAASGLSEETLWLLGPSAVTAFDALPRLELRSESRGFPSSGVYIMSREGLRLTIDAGPLGVGHCGHSHADALSITVTADGYEWLTDPGTFTYTGSREWREAFRGTAAHNTLVIEGQNQAEPTAPFKWEKIPEVRVDEWWTGENFDLIIASHNGYLKSRSRATHQRLVFFAKPRFWLVLDSVRGEGNHQLDIYWHIGGGTTRLDEGAIDLSAETGAEFGIVPTTDPKWSVELIEGWSSTCYGHRQSARILRCSTRTDLPAEFATLLIPRLNEACGRLERFGSTKSTGGPRGFQYSTDSEQHWWVLADRSEPWHMERLESDARLAYLGPDRVFLWEGSFLSLDGVQVVKLPARQRCFEKGWLAAGEAIAGATRTKSVGFASSHREQVH